jgi:hypothetical protein
MSDLTGFSQVVGQPPYPKAMIAAALVGPHFFREGRTPPYEDVPCGIDCHADGIGEARRQECCWCRKRPALVWILADRSVALGNVQIAGCVKCQASRLRHLGLNRR